MPTVGKLTQQGELKIAGEINTRLPLVTDGLVSHMPMDGRAGTFDCISGNSPVQNTTIRANLIEAMELDWRDPSSWQSNFGMSYDAQLDAIKVVGYHNTWLKTPIVVNTSMNYEISIEVMETVQSSVGLYIGGYSLDANGTSATNNFDYTLAANDQPATGVWKTYRLTRTGTTTATSSTTTSFGTIKGWTGDAGLLIKYYHFGGLFNYSGGGELYLRNPKIEIMDPDNSGVTITDDYVAIEEATTNIITNTNLDTGWSKGYCTDILWNDIHPPLGINSQVVSFKDSDGNGNGYWYCYGDYAPQNPSTTYTISIYARTVGNPVRMQAYTADNSEVGRQWTNTLTVPGNGEWVRLVFNAITTPSNTQSDSLSFFLSSFPPNQRLWFCAPQMEAKSFATEFNINSRLKPSLSYNLGIKSSGTVHFSFVKKWYDTYGNSNGAYFMIGDGTNLYAFTGNTNVMRIWAADASSNEATRISYTGININEKNIMTVTWNLRILKLYMNGSFVGEFTNFGYEEIVNKNIYFGSEASGTRIANITIKDVSVYDRDLSADEIKKLAKGTHSITATGLITKSIESKPMIPANSVYFPLDLNGNDHMNSFISTKNENTVYTDGSVWVGDGTTNLNTDIGISAMSGLTVTFLGYEAGWKKYGIGGTWNNGTYPYGFAISHVSFTGGVSYTTQLKIRCNVLDKFVTQFSGINYVNQPQNLGGTTYSSKDQNDIITVGRRGFEYTSTTYQSGYLLSRSTDATAFDNTTDFIWIKEAQIETGNYPTPYTSSSRAQSSLHLPYEIIDCKQDFTIYGWWFPKVYADSVYRPCLTRNIPDGNSNYNRILIMGNGTTSRQLLTWVGSDGIAESTLAVPTTTLVRDNEWNFFCLRRNGANIILSLGNSTGISHGSSAIAYRLNADETGQVWQIGEYSNSESNAYHRDYVFSQSALTNDEIENIFKSKMKATKDGLYIQNGISSNNTL